MQYKEEILSATKNKKLKIFKRILVKKLKMEKTQPETAPLESIIVQEQREKLLKPAPPTYDQATSTPEGAPQQVVVITQPSQQLPYGPQPIDVLCPFCHNYTRTRIRHRPTSRTHLIALLLCIFQLYCCVCLPYLIRSCMKTNHYCGLCDNYLGTYARA